MLVSFMSFSDLIVTKLQISIGSDRQNLVYIFRSVLDHLIKGEKRGLDVTIFQIRSITISMHLRYLQKVAAWQIFVTHKTLTKKTL